MAPVDTLAAQGAAVLALGDWAGARRHFEASLEQEETPAALEGLSDALFWLEEIGQSIERRTRACVIYQEAGDACRAARAALWLAMSYFSALNNGAAGNGWLQRAERLLEHAGSCAELVQLRGRRTPDAATAVGQAREALAIARQYSDLDLEVWALSEQGRGLVSLGDVEAGRRCSTKLWRRQPLGAAISSSSVMRAATCSRPAIAPQTLRVRCNGARSSTHSRGATTRSESFTIAGSCIAVSLSRPVVGSRPRANCSRRSVQSSRNIQPREFTA